MKAILEKGLVMAVLLALCLLVSATANALTVYPNVPPTGNALTVVPDASGYWNYSADFTTGVSSWGDFYDYDGIVNGPDISLIGLATNYVAGDFQGYFVYKITSQRPMEQIQIKHTAWPGEILTYILTDASDKFAIAIGPDGNNYVDEYVKVAPYNDYDWPSVTKVLGTGTAGVNEVYVKYYWNVSGGHHAFQTRGLSIKVKCDIVDRTAPISNAGNDVVAIVGDVVTLNGAGSTDPVVGGISSGIGSYLWSTGETTVTIDVDVTSMMDKTISLVVADNAGNVSQPAYVRVRDIGSFIGDLLPPGLNKIMERGGVGN